MRRKLSMSFTHLKVFTGHSLSKSIIKPEDLIEKLKADKASAFAVVDVNNTFNSIEVYKEALENGLKPIVGATLYIYDTPDSKEKSEISVYVKDEKGYLNLNSLISRAWLDNNKDENSGIVKDWLTAENMEGLVVLSGAKQGKIGQRILAGDMAGAQTETQFWKSLIGENFFIELQRDASVDETAYMQGAVALCESEGVAPVATHCAYFLEPEDFLVHEIKTCISSGDKLYDRKRITAFNKDMYLKSEKEMEALFADLPEALANTEVIRKKCNYQISLDKPQLPIFPTEEGTTEDAVLIAQAHEGLQKRMVELYPDEKERASRQKEYTDRLNLELGVIQRMGFSGYFLIVADFINYSKSVNIPVGVGRGSGAGSLVAYSTGITGIDPLKYGLLFERFLNPERVSMPDFDIDFCPDGRGEVIQYVKNKYGHDKVAQISTFGTLGAKAAIKDVGKVLGYPYGVTDTISKLINIPPAKAHEIKLKTYLFGDKKKNIEGDPKLKELYDIDDDVKTIIDLALKLEGLPRQVGMHAGGVLIAPSTMTAFTPLYRKDNESEPISQFDKDSVEKAGLVKFDFLGLSSLTVIKKCLATVNEKRAELGQEPLDLEKLDLEDEGIFKEIFAAGNTTNVFQFESGGMKAQFRKTQPDKFEDLIALNALYRPGPMDIIGDWTDARQQKPEDREYPHESLKGILEETYGFMIYQEQVMQCAQIIAGFSLGKADMLRRAMGKKKPEEMAKMRIEFIEGAAKNNIDEKKANYLFDLIDKFSGYGFNKSHAAAYSYIAYQTAYLKYYYTAEYMAANLNSDLEDTDKLEITVNDARQNNILILPPDINQSNGGFKIESSDSIRYGLQALKGVGAMSVEFIEKTRKEKGDFVDIIDFLEKVPKGTINKRAFEPMIQAGVFDSIHPNRAQLFESVSDLLNYHKEYHKKAADESNSMLVSEIPDFAPPTRKKKIKVLERPVFKEVQEWEPKQSLVFEKTAMGFYLTGDPSAAYLKDLGGLRSADSLKELEDNFNVDGKSNALVSGVITEIRPYKSKTGAFVKIANGSQSVDIMVKNAHLDKNKELFKVDGFVALQLNIFADDKTEGAIRLSAQNVFSLEDMQKKTIEKMFVGGDVEKLQRFEEICQPYQNQNAKTPVKFCVEREPGGRREKVAALIDVDFSAPLLEELRKEFGEKWVKMTFVDKVNLFSFNNDNKRQSRRPY